MKKQKVAFYTLGCKVNQYETNAMIQQFISKGYEIIDFNDVADIYIINTCTVTNMSDRKSRQILKRAKNKNNKAIIVVTGCYAQVAKEELEKNKNIDIILGVKEKADIVKQIEQYKNKQYTNVEQHNKGDKYLEYGDVTYTKNERVVIKIQDGCDMFCTYCIIPYARGRVRSRKLESIIKEVSALAKNQIKEVVLTGIHIASYGKDLNNNIELIDVLEEINKIDGIERIRLRFFRTNNNNRRICKKITKIRKNLPSFSFIPTKWL